MRRILVFMILGLVYEYTNFLLILHVKTHVLFFPLFHRLVSTELFAYICVMDPGGFDLQELFCCAILAGGRNSRFGGKHKCLFRLGEDLIINSILKVVRPVFKDVMLVVNDSEAFTGVQGVRLVPDLVKGQGPLSGIHSALCHASAPGVFIMAGDMPFPDANLIRILCTMFQPTDTDVVFPVVDHSPEPLFGVYNASLSLPLESFLRGQERKIVTFYKGLRLKKCKLSPRSPYVSCFININSPEDLIKPS